MAQRIVLAVDADIAGGLDAARRCARQLSYELQEPVLVVDVTGTQLDVIRATALREEGLVSEQELVAGYAGTATGWQEEGSAGNRTDPLGRSEPFAGSGDA